MVGDQLPHVLERLAVLDLYALFLEEGDRVIERPVLVYGCGEESGVE
jgi:hypothetical protein